MYENMAERLKEQSKYHNSWWVMELLAEAGAYVETLERENDILHSLLHRHVDLTPQGIKIVSSSSDDPYEEAMKILD